MFRRRNRILRIVFIVSDFITTSLAFFIFNILRFKILHPNLSDAALFGYLSSTKLVVEQIGVPLVLLLVYFLSGFYNHPFPRSRISDYLNTAACGLTSTLLIFLTMLVNDPTPRRRTEYLLLFLLFILLLVFVYSGRLLITTIAMNRARASQLTDNTVIIGNSKRGFRAAEMLLSARTLYDNRIAAFVALDNEKRAQNMLPEIPVIPLSELKVFCKAQNVTQIVLAPEMADFDKAFELIADFFDLEIPIKVAPDDIDYAMPGIRTNDIMGHTLIDLSSPRLSDFASNVKRVFDISISLLVLILLSPFFILIGCLVKLDSPGPVFYTQERMGRKHRPFRIIKFRTMRTDAEATGPRLSSDSDNRITKIGRILRKYRIDELPQFWNVLKGEMSIVGPRPEREYYIRQIVKHVPFYSLVYQVRPGITSWAMVKFGYASTLSQMVERTRFDLIYINNMSLLLDLKIMIHTILTIIKGAGK